MSTLLARRSTRWSRFDATYNPATNRIEFVGGSSCNWNGNYGLHRHSVDARTDLKCINAHWAGFVRNITVKGRAPKITAASLQAALASRCPR